LPVSEAELLVSKRASMSRVVVLITLFTLPPHLMNLSSSRFDLGKFHHKYGKCAVSVDCRHSRLYKDNNHKMLTSLDRFGMKELACLDGQEGLGCV
jgi:hypothetical protein